MAKIRLEEIDIIDELDLDSSEKEKDISYKRIFSQKYNKEKYEKRNEKNFRANKRSLKKDLKESFLNDR